MATKQLKNYQEKAVNKLLSRTKELFDESLDKRTIVFQAPTGSGKTFMMSQYIEQLIEEFEDKDLCFLWLSIGKGALHMQSYDSLRKYHMVLFLLLNLHDQAIKNHQVPYPRLITKHLTHLEQF